MEVTYITTLEDQKEIHVLNDSIRSNRIDTVLNAQKMLNEYSYFHVRINQHHENKIGSIHDIITLITNKYAILCGEKTIPNWGSGIYKVDNTMKPRISLKKIRSNYDSN